jgi:opacity protein-like surface antigen
MFNLNVIRMKKLLLLLVLFVSFAANAQTHQGESAFGFNMGYGFDSKNAVLGIDYRYGLTDEVRLTPSLSYFVKNNGRSACAIDLNAQYVFLLSDMVGFYPLAGLDLSFWKHPAGEGTLTDTRFGVNLGMGLELYATQNVTVGIEAKYTIIKDFDQAILGVRVGYSF